MNKSTTTTRIQLVIEVESTGSWDQNCTVHQVRNASSEMAINQVRKIFNDAKRPCRIIGEPKVILFVQADK